MKREEIILAMQFAVEQLTTALANISQLDEESVHDTQLTASISLSTDRGENEIVIFEDAKVLFAPGYKPPSRFSPAMQLGGRPKALGPRTCPTCKGKGTI